MKSVFDMPKAFNNPARLSRYLKMMRVRWPNENALRLQRRMVTADSQRLREYARIGRGEQV